MNPSRFHNRRGVALILTLTILAIVLILLMAFITSMRTERVAAKGYTDYVKAKLLADAAVNEAIGFIQQGTPLQTDTPPTSFWTAPGLALTFQNGTFSTVPLYSIANGPIDYTNLNVNGLITGSNAIISANSGIYVQWVNVSTNAAAPDATHPLIGRFAYWVDDEATKINLNSANVRDPLNGNTTNSSRLSEVDFRALMPPLNETSGTVATNIVKARTDAAFNTPDEFRRATNALGTGPIDALGYISNQFVVTSYSIDTNTDTWGRQRIDLNTLLDGDVSTSSNAYKRLEDATQLYRKAYPFWNAGAATLVQKYGSANVLQMLANIVDYRTNNSVDATHDALDSTLEVPRNYCGLKKGPFLNEIILHAIETNHFNIVTNATVYSTNWDVNVRVFADVELYNPFPGSTNGLNYQIFIEPDPANPISFQIFVGTTNNTTLYGTATGINNNNHFPIDAGGINATVGTKTMTMNAQTITLNAAAVTWPAGAQGITNGDFWSLSYTNVFGAGPFAPNWQFLPKAETTIAGVAKTSDDANEVPGVTNIQVYIRRVLLRQTTTAGSIRDWAIATKDIPQPITISKAILWKQDLSQNARMTRFFTAQSGGDFDKEAKGVAKNDPRVRSFPNVTPLGTTVAWVPTHAGNSFDPSPHSDNSGGIFEQKTQVFVPSLMADGSERVAPPNQGNFAPSTFYIKEAPFQSPGELGFIHTGVPWRTLRMQTVMPPPNSLAYASTGLVPLPNENRVIPDWVLLDIFTAGMPTSVVGRVNINSTLFGSNDFPRPTSVTDDAMSPRNPSVAGLLYSMTTTPLNYPVVSNPVTIATNFWWGTTTFNVNSMTQASPQPSSFSLLSSSNLARFVAWSHDTSLSAIVHKSYWAANAASDSSYYYDTNTLFLTPGEICEVAGIDNALVAWDSGGNPAGPRKADKELIPRKIANLITTRSNAFTIWTMAQAIFEPPAAAGQVIGTYQPGIDLVTGEVKVQAVVERYVDTSGATPAVKFRTLYYRYIYE